MYELVEINRSDLELLRIAKNSHRKKFFYDRRISKTQQVSWYENAYLTSSDTTIYKIVYKEKICGVFGVYLRTEDKLELFNLIAIRKNRIQGLFSKVIKTFCCQNSKGKKSCFVRVLAENPAVGWYTSIGFNVIANYDGYVEMEYAND